MNKFVQYLLVKHPAGGWFRKEVSGKRRKQTNNNKFFSSPDGHHSRNGVTKKENPRYNPAP